MTAKIHPQQSPVQTLVEGSFGPRILANLTIPEQHTIMLVSKRWQEQTNVAQRNELTARFPHQHLSLAGGDLTKVPLRNLRQVDCASLAKLPNLAMGWVKVA